MPWADDVIAETDTRTVRAEDGRNLFVRVAGRDPQRCVFVTHGMPGCGRLYGSWIEDAAARNIQLVSYDRPGYGGSSPHPGHSVADCAADVMAIADDLGIDHLAIWGWSGGGPYALACAALLPDLVVATAVLASGAPWGAPGLDFFAGMGQNNIDEIELYLSDPVVARQRNRQDRDEVLAMTTGRLAEGLASVLSPVDGAVLTGEFSDWLLGAEQNGLAPGDQGWWDDGVALLSRWGFDPQSISIPVKVWHGRHDRFVPFQHGQWLVDHIPGAESALTETDGHLTLVLERIGDVHAWLGNHF
jgi:pimeloyl-ACP methyl ester carboxylesterase